MLKSLLIGLDESEFSAAAVAYGLELAKRYQCALGGVAIVYEPIFGDSTLKPRPRGKYASDFERLIKETSDRCSALLKNFQSQVEEAGIRYTLLKQEGLPSRQIATEAQRFDLTLLGQETHFNFDASAKPCATLRDLLWDPPRPVIAVPKQRPPGSGALIAYDGSHSAARTLHAFISSGLAESGPLYLLMLHGNKQEADEVMARAGDYLRAHQLPVEHIHQTDTSTPGPSIIAEAQRRNVELIVMGAYGHSAVSTWLFGSTTLAVLQSSPLPVFLYH